MARRLAAHVCTLSITVFGCRAGEKQEDAHSHGEAEGWAVTAWGDE